MTRRPAFPAQRIGPRADHLIDDLVYERPKLSDQHLRRARMLARLLDELIRPPRAALLEAADQFGAELVRLGDEDGVARARALIGLQLPAEHPVADAGHRETTSRVSAVSEPGSQLYGGAA